MSTCPSSVYEAGKESLHTLKTDIEPEPIASELELVRRSLPCHTADDALKWQSGSSTNTSDKPSVDINDSVHSPGIPKTAISGMVAAISPIRFSSFCTESYAAPELDVWASHSPCLQRSTLSGSIDEQEPESFVPLSFNSNEDRGIMELNDAAWDPPPLPNEFNKSSDKFMPFTDTLKGIRGLEEVDPTIVGVPGMEPRRVTSRQNHQICTSLSESPHDNALQEWEEAKERVMLAAIHCLSRGDDMEQAYICILSTISVLQRGGQQTRSTSKCARKLLRIITQPKIAERLGMEIQRQRVVTPATLYYQVYQAMQDAGYALEQEDHLRVCQFSLDHGSAQDALSCLARVESAEWDSSTYRTAISCHLFCKPRRLQEAEVLLDRYLSHSRTLLLRAHGATSKPKKDHQERERATTVMIQKWFRLQLDASKWEETKTLYERRRARLLEAPANNDRFLSTLSLSEVETKPEQARVSDPVCQRPHHDEELITRASSLSSFTADIAAPSLKDIPTTTGNVTPQSESKVAKEVPTKRRFSFLSALKSTSSLSLKGTATTALPSVDTRKPKSVKSPPNLTTLQTATGSGTSNIHVNRHLTVLDNGMLEECINHKQFEYGWKYVYERMGPARLEDKDTAKIAMRLCKRAFLGHGGLSPHLKGGSSSPNLLARELCFEDDKPSHDEKGREGTSKLEGNDGAEHEDGTTSKREGERSGDTSGSLSWKKNCKEDAEVWEARAWAIYNKAMTNPFFLSSTGNTPSVTPTQPHQPATTTLVQGGSGGPGTTRGGALSLSSPITGMAGTTSLAVFLHNILTVAIHSPEHSSRYMKAFKVYCSMRNDPLSRYQAQLRDPFVMTCMFKAIYDTVLAIIKTQSRDQQQMPQMTIGPLLDLSFEIYADMRNVGPIRLLPRLSALAPLTPIPRTPKTPGPVRQSTSLTVSSVQHSLSGNMSMFFNLSNRPSTSPSQTTVDLSACGSMGAMAAPSATTATEARSTATKSALSVVPTVQLQDLNPTLQPNPLARRLPNELYLALLHLCIQVPLSGLSTSSKVVQTIVSDMMSTHAGQQPANLDSHLAAALQFYHDRWMCRPQELKERPRSCCSAHGGDDQVDDDDNSKCEGCSHHRAPTRARRGSATEDDPAHHDHGDEQNRDGASADCQRGGDHEGCIYHGWMYQPESYILQHMTPSNVSSANSSLSNLCDSHLTTERSTTTTAAAAVSSLSSSSSTTVDTDLPSIENENSQYGIFKHDADLDELDQYLNARVQPIDQRMPDSKRSSDWVLAEEQNAPAQWMDGLEHDTCNDRFYWDLWSRQDPVLHSVRFSRRRARMLWRHVGSIDM
ncbi:unnamed protein product [Mortierella alpina]